MFSFKGKIYLRIKVTWKGTNFYFLNIYSPCRLANKRLLWLELLQWKDKLEPIEWVVGGYFNATKSLEEMSRRSSGSRTTEMEEFNSFIELVEVVDLPVVGNKHTWIKSYGSSSIRIGRLLLSGGLVNDWKIVAQVSGNRDISDHMLVWIKASNLNWGPKSFKVFNCWFDHKDFLDFVKK